MFNRGMASSGLESCGALNSLPLLQDDDAMSLWNRLGADYNGFQVYDSGGILVREFTGVVFPDLATPLEETLAPLLSQ